MDVSKTVDLSDYLNRYPKALSGGQKQRVAMGRSIAKEAKILLMDEPLSNLDAKLRQQTRKELAILHSELKSTIVYVTHDQTEAMTMASRIVVIKEGRIQQTGTPYEVYHYPENIFTASFIGSPGINLIKGRIDKETFTALNEKKEPCFEFNLPAGILGEFPREIGNSSGYPVTLGIRPENIITEDDKISPLRQKCCFEAEVHSLELLGAEYYAGLKVMGLDISSRIPARREIKIGQKIEAALNLSRAHFFNENTGLRIKYENN
jgi:multiple sugar transport system ATP-binding protein